MKNTITTLSILINFITMPAFSTVLHWTECDSGVLKVQNKSAVAQKVWLQTFNPTLISETEAALQPLETVQFSLTKRSKSERQALLHFTNIKDIETTFQCRTDNYTKNYYATNLEGGVLTFRKSDLTQQSLSLKNLTQEKTNLKSKF